MRITSISAVLFSLLLAGACATEVGGGGPMDTGMGDSTGMGDDTGNGDGSGNGDDTGNGDGTGDGNGDGTGGGTDVPAATICLASPSISAGAGAPEVTVDFQDGTTGPLYIDAYVPLAEGNDGHVLNVSLWDGYGVFAAGLKTGTFPLTGDELSMANCGACVAVFSDATETEFFMASSGTVTVTAVSTTAGSQFTASVADIAFRQLRVDPTTEMVADVPGGCEANLATAQISATVQVATPNPTP